MLQTDNGSANGSEKRRAKPIRKRHRIEQALRRQIVEGQYGAGARLPLRVELERRFAASPVTVQRALDRLSEEGFVQARGRGGTYVVDHPPHLSRYGLAFAHCPGEEGWNRFWTALSNEAQMIERRGPRTIRVYYGVNKEPSQAYQALLADVQADRLAGLIFAFYPGWLEGTPLLTSGVPNVIVLCEQTWPGMSAVTFDSKGLIDKALDFFVSRGRRRVATLSLPWFAETNERYIASAIENRGLITHPYWSQAMSHSPSRWVQSCAHLLTHGKQTERPDALLIADDNLIEPATAGLVAAGVRVPEDLDIVGHCNFPWPAPSHLPITRVGYDIRRFLRSCIESIDRQRGGEDEPTIVESPALLESETRAARQGLPAPRGVGDNARGGDRRVV